MHVLPAIIVGAFHFRQPGRCRSGLAQGVILRNNGPMSVICIQRAASDMSPRSQAGAVWGMVTALVLSGSALGPVMAQTSDMPVFDLIYLDEPPEAAPAELIAQRPTGPAATRSSDAGATVSHAPDMPIIRLASLTPSAVTGADMPDPRQRIIGTDVTEPAPGEVDSELSAELSPEELALELQQELARVGCYRLRVDGQWGPGSRRALANYLTRSEQSSEGREPTPALLQMVRDSDDGICPAPVAQAPRTTRPARTATPQPPRAVQPAAPVAVAPPASGGGGSRLQGALRGGFR